MSDPQSSESILFENIIIIDPISETNTNTHQQKDSNYEISTKLVSTFEVEQSSTTESLQDHNTVNNESMTNTTDTSSLSLKIAKTTGSIALNVATSGIGRKAIFAGTLYFAGATIVSTVGIVPVIVAGTLIWIL